MTDQRIKDWLQQRENNKITMMEISYITEHLKLSARLVPLPDNLRPAMANDITLGAIIWYKGESMDSGKPRWFCVEEVLRPMDPWKAFCGDDGCRYGLDGAFVEVE